MSTFYKIDGEYFYLYVKVLPGASKTCLGEVKENRLKIKIAAVPQDGKANDEIRSFLSKTVGVPKRDIVIEAGEKARLKTLRLPVAVKDFFANF